MFSRDPSIRGSATLRRALLLSTIGLSILAGHAARAQASDEQTQPLELRPISVEGEAEDEAGDPTPPVYSGGQVSRGGRLGALGNQDMMEVPFTVTSYTEELIRNQQAQTVGEVLANDPAVRTTTGYGIAGEMYVIRGFPLNGEDVSIDGLYGNAPRQIVATEPFERVEVLKGASAFLNGVPPSGSGIGGSINLVPKRAEDDPLSRVTLGYGMDSQVGTHVDFGRRFGEDKAFGVRANLARRYGETSIEDEERSLVLGSVALDHKGERHRVSLDLSHQEQTIDEPRPMLLLSGTGAPSAPDASSNYARDWTYTKLQDKSAQMRLEYDITDSLMAYIVGGARSMREDGEYSSPTVNSSGVGTARRMYVPREDESMSGQTGIQAEFETGSVGHTVNLGASAIHQENRNSWSWSATSAIDIYNPVSPAYPAATAGGGSLTDLPLVSKTELHSFMLSDTLSFLDDDILLTLGARDQTIHVMGYDRASGNETSNYNKSKVSPVAGLTVKVTDWASVYGNRIQGLAQGPTAPTTAANSGEIFAPYDSTQYEVGGKIDLGNFGASLAFFQTEQPVGFTDPTSNIYNVDGEQRNRGVELMLFGEPVKGFRPLGGITLLDAELTKTAGGTNNGNAAVGVPDYQLNLGAEYDLPFLPGVTVGGRVLHTASQFVNAANTQEIPSWTRLDLSARYATEIEERPVSFNLNIENVTDEAYWASAMGGYINQGKPLTAKLSVTADF